MRPRPLAGLVSAASGAILCGRTAAFHTVSTSGQFLLGADPHIRPTTTTSSTMTTTMTAPTTTSIPPTSTTPSTTSSTISAPSTTSSTVTTSTLGATSTTATTSTTSTTLPTAPCARTDCTAAAESAVDVRARAKSDSLAWSLRDDAAMAAGALGDPRPNGGTGYALCVGEGDGRVVFRATVPAGGRCGSQPCWKTTKDGGFRFKGVAGAPIRSVVVVPAGKRGARAGVVAFGRDLLAAGPPLALPVTVQLEAATGACWSATFTSARTRAGRFTAATSR